MKRRFVTALACVMTVSVAVAGDAGQDTVVLLPSPLDTAEPHRADAVTRVSRTSTKIPHWGCRTSTAAMAFPSPCTSTMPAITDLADGANTMPVCREFEVAKQGVMQTYQKLELKAEQMVRLNPPDDLPQMREAHYEYEREERPTISFIWLTPPRNIS